MLISVHQQNSVLLKEALDNGDLQLKGMADGVKPLGEMGGRVPHCIFPRSS